MNKPFRSRWDRQNDTLYCLTTACLLAWALKGCLASSIQSRLRPPPLPGVTSLMSASMHANCQRMSTSMSTACSLRKCLRANTFAPCRPSCTRSPVTDYSMTFGIAGIAAREIWKYGPAVGADEAGAGCICACSKGPQFKSNVECQAKLWLTGDSVHRRSLPRVTDLFVARAVVVMSSRLMTTCKPTNLALCMP